MTNFKRIVAVIILVAAVIGGVMAYSVFRTPAAATAPITAIPLAQGNAGSSTTTTSQPATTTEAVATEAPTDVPTTAAATTEEAATSAATEAPAAATEAPAAAATEAPAEATVASGAVVASIVSSESEARFVIDEVLNDAPKTVVGATNQVAGEIAIDAQDPSKSQVGIIQVNTRTLATDSDFRDRAIKNAILQTDQYEFVTFKPTTLTGLPTSGTVGQAYTFQMTGDLTIRDVTKTVTFDVTVTPTSETRIEGTATATILYADYGISIPQVRQVASVDENVRLEIDFVAQS